MDGTIQSADAVRPIPDGRAPLHVVFHPSARLSLHQALTLSGRQEPIVAIFDDLSFGPIDPPSARKRAAWVGRELAFSGWGKAAVTPTEAVVEVSLAHQGRRIAYISKRCARDYANFLEWLWRIGTMPCEIVDVTELAVHRMRSGQTATKELALSFSRIIPKHMIEHRLLDGGEPLTEAARASYHAQWKQLRTENASLRVVKEGSLSQRPSLPWTR